MEKIVSCGFDMDTACVEPVPRSEIDEYFNRIARDIAYMINVIEVVQPTGHLIGGL